MKNHIIAVFTILYVNKVTSETPANNFTATYDPAELLRKIFNTNESILPRANYGLIQFEGQIPQPDFVSFQLHNNPGDGSVFENEYQPSHNENVQNVVKFEDTTKEGSRKKKRKKRRPKQHYGLQNPGNLPYSPGYGNPEFYPPPSNGGQYYRPRRPRPRPSLASEALSAVTGALTSIALYDDYQCVPRLLCEAAAGGALGSSGILQTVSGLQPLLTLLSAYSGVTSNPLFVFGRAVLLGASSNSNTATCRYAYTHCPTDPEQLVHYLNNYNGGFFRFFNSPQPGQQNVEQFYDQLAQNYGLYQPNQEYDHNSQPNNGFQNNQQNHGFHNPNLYSNYDQNYGVAYPYQNNNQNIRFKNNDDYSENNRNRIGKRIQNNPNTLYIDDSKDENPRWTFPEGNKKPVHYVNNDVFNVYTSNDDNFDNNDKLINHYDENYSNRYHNDHRKGKILKFPGVNNEDDYLDATYDKNRGSFFPENQNNKQHLNYNYSPIKNNYDKDYYDNQQQHINYNTPAQNNKYYDSKYDDNNHYNYGSNNNFDSEYHNNRYNSHYNTPINQNIDTQYVNRDEYYANQYYANRNKYNNDNYANKGKYYNYNNAEYENKYNYNNDQDQGVRTVYVIRGNGDPNNPEIHKLRPGQTVP